MGFRWFEPLISSGHGRPSGGQPDAGSDLWTTQLGPSKTKQPNGQRKCSTEFSIVESKADGICLFVCFFLQNKNGLTFSFPFGQPSDGDGGPTLSILFGTKRDGFLCPYLWRSTSISLISTLISRHYNLTSQFKPFKLFFFHWHQQRKRWKTCLLQIDIAINRSITKCWRKLSNHRLPVTSTWIMRSNSNEPIINSPNRSLFLLFCFFICWFDDWFRKSIEYKFPI